MLPPSIQTHALSPTSCGRQSHAAGEPATQLVVTASPCVCARLSGCPYSLLLFYWNLFI